MRWPRIRRLAWPLALLLWLGSVSCYWWSNVPIPLTGSFDIADHLEAAGLSADGKVVLVHRNQSSSDGSGDAGPIIFLDPINDAPDRQLLASTDRLLKLHLGRRMFAAAEKAGVISVVDLETGRTLISKDGQGESFNAEFSGDGSLVAFSCRSDVTIFRVDDGHELWSESHVDWRGFCGPELVQISSGGLSWDRRFLKVTTWEEDHRFGNCFPMVVTPDANWAIAQDDSGEYSLHDYRSGDQKWRFAGSPDISQTFAADSSEIWSADWAWWHDGEPQFDRWRLQDGGAPTVSGENGIGVLGNGKYLALRLPSRSLEPDGWLSQLLYRVGGPWTELPFYTPPGLLLIDRSTGRPAGKLLIERWDEGGGFDSLHESERGLLIESQWGHFLFWRYPLRRNWLWLFGWSLGPPVILWLVKRLAAHRRDCGN